MTKSQVSVIFDRKRRAINDGIGTVDVFVYLSRTQRKYITVGKCKRSEFEQFKLNKNVVSVVNRCNEVITALAVLNLEENVSNFNAYYNKDEKKSSADSKKVYKGTNLMQNFVDYMQKRVDVEDILKGTRIHKQVTIEALKRFGKIKTFADLTPHNIMLFDEWLHDGTREDISIYTYHKHIHKVTRHMRMAEMIPVDPYDLVTIARGKSKPRRPLTEDELKQLRKLKLTGKMETARDLFIFAAYTGLAYCDLVAFDFKTMAVKEGNLYYIDGSRIKTDAPFFTPILAPAMAILKEYKYKLPYLWNQKVNDYLHLIEEKMGLNKSLTFHVARHSFATIVLAHDVPIENVARMLGHRDIKITQIYASAPRLVA